MEWQLGVPGTTLTFMYKFALSFISITKQPFLMENYRAAFSHNELLQIAVDKCSYPG